MTVGNGSASKTLTSNSYDSRNRLTSALYGNGQRVNYKYDSLDRPVIKYYNNDNPNNAGYHTVYNANGLVGLHKDVVNTQRTRYTYDLAQRLVRVRRNVGVLEDNGAFLAELAYTYENNTNRLSAYTLELLLGSGTSKVKTSFTYGNKNGSQMTDAVYEVRQNGGLHKTYTYDGLGRKTQTMMSMGGVLFELERELDMTGYTVNDHLCGGEGQPHHFSPKYRRKVIYNQLRADIQQYIRDLCKWKGVEILEGHMMPDHVHLLLSIPSKYCVSSFMGYLKGKTAMMIFEKHGNLKYKFWNRHFWATGY